MGKSMYSYGKQVKEKARQQKQLEKTAKRIAAKQQKENLQTGAPAADAETAEPAPEEKAEN
ncbi:MAG: hypothetical protein K0B01_06830 [Syntrophobacterales bacterium]|nr:hypothetical protein [Syntrophobacterales bacterium]